MSLDSGKSIKAAYFEYVKENGDPKFIVFSPDQYLSLINAKKESGPWIEDDNIKFMGITYLINSSHHAKNFEFVR